MRVSHILKTLVRRPCYPATATMFLTALALFLIVIFTRHAPSAAFAVNPTLWGNKATSVRSVTSCAVTSSAAAVSNEISFRTPSERQGLLEEAIGFNQTAANLVIEEANLLRSMNGTASITLEEFWNDLLTWADQGDNGESSLPWWTKIGVLARFSKRARRASLRRVLDLTTPYSDDDATARENDSYRFSKRRRALAVLVRSLASAVTNPEATDASNGKKKHYPAIRELEQQARKARHSAILGAEDRQNRLPPGLETPKYTVLKTGNSLHGKYEIRRYEPFSVCSVSMVQPRPVDATKTDAKISFPSMGGASAFGALAGYLFGKNQQETSMKMTTPVLSSSDNSQMSFVLPSAYWSGAQAAPKPLSESGVSLENIDGEDRAVIMFGGYASRKIIELRSKQLLDGLGQDSEWKVDNNAPVMVAQYNDPFTPPWKRLNEVSVRVIAR
jgi:hypothetical protein